MGYLVWTLFIPDGRMTRREVRTFGVRQVTTDEVMDGEVSVEQRKRGRLFLVGETMAGGVYPPVLVPFFGDP